MPEPYWHTSEHEGKYQIIDWSESGWSVFSVLGWFFYLVLIVPILFIVDLIRGRKRD